MKHRLDVGQRLYRTEYKNGQYIDIDFTEKERYDFFVKHEIENKENILQNLNNKRNNELKGFTINNIFLNKEVLYDMSVKYASLQDDEKARWIDIDNKTVEFTKDELGALIKQGTDRVESIYFKYRQLKDDLLKVE